MALPVTDPRIYFAAERTLLAWVRTGITIMALGFVISRFGLFVQLLTVQSNNTNIETNSSLSAFLGVAFILVGAFSIIFSAIQHKRFISTLPTSELPPRYSKVFAILLSTVIGALGAVLAFYLLITG
jgi:putative membrane protein